MALTMATAMQAVGILMGTGLIFTIVGAVIYRATANDESGSELKAAGYFLILAGPGMLILGLVLYVMAINGGI
jgi:hypothetical protein